MDVRNATQNVAFGNLRPELAVENVRGRPDQNSHSMLSTDSYCQVFCVIFLQFLWR